jgi:RNAse (barnase) inhibitor barstar
MRTIHIDCSGVRSVDDLWQRYVDAAEPADAKGFGRNLDAFWDAIEGGGPGWPGEARLVFTHSSDLVALQTENGTLLLDALRRIANEATVTPIELD